MGYGFARDYSWLRVPVLDAHGEIIERHGMTRAPGLVVLGMPFLRKRNSAFIDGVGGDAAMLAGQVATFLSPASWRRTASDPPAATRRSA
jgi:putative flavoprotein involved in K+ transport